MAAPHGMRTLWKTYSHLLAKYPITTNAIQAGVLMGTGDVIAQTAVEKKPLRQMDTLRTARFVLIGATFVGPTLCWWYRTLDRICLKGTTSSHGVATLKKVVFDQAGCAPIFLFSFLTLVGLLQRQTPEEIRNKISKDYMDILKTNWSVWPIVQIANFYFIPLSHRVTVANFVALFWNTYLSWKANQ